MRSGKFKILICFAVVFTMLFAMATPAMAATDPDAWKNNGVGLDKLKATDVGLAIGGNSYVNPTPQGFTNNFVYLTAAELDAIYSSKTTVDSLLGSTECFVSTPVSYTSYENHGTPVWRYWKSEGLDLKQIAKNLGFDTDSQEITIQATATDGYTYPLGDAFNHSASRSYFGTTGEKAGAVLPMLGMYMSCYEVSGAENVPSASKPAQWPSDPSSTDKKDLTFAFGHNALDEVNHCYWVGSVNRIHIGDEKPALTVNKATGTDYAQISRIVAMGVYSTDYSYYSSGVNTINSHHVTGIPLSVFLEKMGITVGSNQEIKTACSDGYIPAAIQYGDIGKWFLAWNATDNNNGNAQIKNDDNSTYNTALRLYGPGQYGNTAVIRDLSEITIADKATKTALNDALADADYAKMDVTVSTDGKGLAAGSLWATKSAIDTFNAAIASAQAVSDSSAATSSQINIATAALKAAITAFKASIHQLVSKITLDKTTLTLANGKTGKLTPTVTKSTATNKAVEWSSSNTKVATVNATGTVTATGIGSAVITCAAKDGSGVAANCKVTVKSRSIQLSKTSAALLSGKKVKLSAALTNGKGAPKKTTLCWKSSNTKVAKVDAKGNVQGVAKGTATITCYAKDDKTVLATCTVTVSQAVTGIKLSASQKTVAKGKTLAIKAKITPSAAANKKVTWKTSSAKIAKVDANGVVTGVAKGLVTITCTAADGSGVKATIKITVK